MLGAMARALVGIGWLAGVVSACAPGEPWVSGTALADGVDPSRYDAPEAQA